MVGTVQPQGHLHTFLPKLVRPTAGSVTSDSMTRATSFVDTFDTRAAWDAKGYS